MTTIRFPVSIPVHSIGKLSIRPISRDIGAHSREARDWCDLASQRDWQGAILVYLRQCWREALPLWSVINQIAAEARPRNRRELRSLKMEILKAMGELVRSRRVLRWHRTKLAILDT